MKPLPPELGDEPFTRAEAAALGVSDKMLRGRRITALHRGVYCLTRADGPTEEQRRAGARLALPSTARLTGISRIQELGLDYGPRRPLRFVVEGDLHLAIDGLFLHRTKAMPPNDGMSVGAEAAFVSYCSKARLIDAIKVGDWLARNEHMELGALAEFAYSERWRSGAHEALFVFDRLTPDSWSLKESETAAVLESSGLPRPEFNRDLGLRDRTVIGDLVYRDWRTIVEYEGRHHQQDRAQYVADIDRFELIRSSGYRYVKVTAELLSRPRTVVRAVHRALCEGGYDGPEPAFGDSWDALFMRLTRLVPRELEFKSLA